jgi:undecaprenyl-diphosphatase
LALAAFWIVATGWSRLALGAHYLSDVLGGYLLGSIFFVLGAVVIDRLAARAEVST